MQSLPYLPSLTRILAIASGKGGVGKSAVSSNLSLALQDRGYSVGLFDADIYGPSLPLMLETDKFPQKDPVSSKIIPGRSHGISFVSMAHFIGPSDVSAFRAPIVSGLIKQFLHDVAWGELDYLIIDCPPGTGDIHLSLTQNVAMTGALIVTTPQKVSRLDAQKALSLFEKLSIPIIGIVENMSFFSCDCGKSLKIFGGESGKELSESSGVPLLAKIPLDSRISFSGDNGIPIVHREPDTAIAKAFGALAQDVDEEIDRVRESEKGGLRSFSLEWKRI